MHPYVINFVNKYENWISFIWNSKFHKCFNIKWRCQLILTWKFLTWQVPSFFNCYAIYVHLPICCITKTILSKNEASDDPWLAYNLRNYNVSEKYSLGFIQLKEFHLIQTSLKVFLMNDCQILSIVFCISWHYHRIFLSSSSQCSSRLNSVKFFPALILS